MEKSLGVADRRYPVPRRGTISLPWVKPTGRDPQTNKIPVPEGVERLFSPLGGKRHSTPSRLAIRPGASFPWVSPTANDSGPL